LPLVAAISSDTPARPANELGRKTSAAIVHSTAEMTAEM
jgi:hypothetical protein